MELEAAGVVVGTLTGIVGAIPSSKPLEVLPEEGTGVAEEEAAESVPRIPPSKPVPVEVGIKAVDVELVEAVPKMPPSRLVELLVAAGVVGVVAGESPTKIPPSRG